MKMPPFRLLLVFLLAYVAVIVLQKRSTSPLPLEDISSAQIARVFFLSDWWSSISPSNLIAIHALRTISNIGVVFFLYLGHLFGKVPPEFWKANKTRIFLHRDGDPGTLLSVVIEDLRILGDRKKEEEGGVPLVIYFHGGGMVLGDAPDPLGSLLMINIGEPCIIAHVDYRKSPEYPFPASAEDGFHALKYFANYERAKEIGYDANRIALLGVSAGGNLVVSVSSLARDRGIFPKVFLQIPIIPMLHVNGTGQSVEESKDNGILTSNLLHWFWHLFTANHDDPSSCISDIRCSPLSALKHNFQQLPPAVVMTATGDVMRDDGRTYVEELRKAGVRVDHCEVVSSHSGVFFTDQTRLRYLIKDALFGSRKVMSA